MIGQQTVATIPVRQSNQKASASDKIMDRKAYKTTDNVSVVMPFKADMSSAMTLVNTPGAFFSESNQLIYLYMIPLSSSLRTLWVRCSPATP
jgi:hypothetical protein